MRASSPVKSGNHRPLLELKSRRSRAGHAGRSRTGHARRVHASYAGRSGTGHARRVHTSYAARSDFADARLGYDGFLACSAVADQRFLFDGHCLLLFFWFFDFLLLHAIVYSTGVAKLRREGALKETIKESSTYR